MYSGWQSVLVTDGVALTQPAVLAYPVSLLLFHLTAWVKVVAEGTEHNTTRCTGFCSPHALISTVLPGPSLFLDICNPSWSFSALGFPDRTVL